MTIFQTKTNQSASSNTISTQEISLGIDPGNGRLKALSSNGYSIRIPSLLYFPHSEISVGQLDTESSHVVYTGGARSDLWSKQWILGKEAYVIAPDIHLSTSDDKEAKAKYCLELLLGAVANILNEGKTVLIIAVSIHDKGSFKDEVIKKLEGSHRTKLNGKDCEIVVQVKSCVDEGVGAYFELLATRRIQKNETVLLLDVGHGTLITSVFGNGELKHRKAYPLGVFKLYSAIANNIQMRKTLKGTPGNLELIKAGIESGHFVYGNNCRLSFNFKDIYKTELSPWVEQSLAKVLVSVQQWQNEASHLFCIGGGIQLPGIKNWFEKRAFECLQDSEWLNARGLLKIAQRK